ncbi:MAG: hypothetical protein AB1637_00100 [Elusimicrobiota bacterium]
MKKFLAAFILYAAQLTAGEFHINNEFSAYYNKITGPGKAASSLTENLSYADLLNINSSGENKGLSYNYNLGLKFTDDERVDAKRVSLSNINGLIKKGEHSLFAGDIFENFSQYSLATALKGASYKFSPQKGAAPEITALFGYAAPRWDSLWKDPLTRIQQKQAWGARMKKNFYNSLDLGISMINSKDVDSYNFASKYETSNIAADFNYKVMPGLTFDGEFSSSDYDEKVSKSSEKGKAFRFQAVGDADPSRVSLEYEEISPDFISPLGSSTPDRRKIKGKWRYKYSKFSTVTTGLLWYRNNLDSQLSDTTYNWRPEISWAIKKPFRSRPYSFADISYKFDRKYGSGSSQGDHYINLNYRDKFGEIDSDSNLGYSLYKTEKDIRDSSEINFNTSFSSRKEKGEWSLIPKINLGLWRSQDELSDYSDKIYEYSLELGAEKPRAGLFAEIKAGQNILKKEDPASDDSAKTFASMSFRKKINIFKTESSVFLRAALNDFNYSTNSNDFREKSVTAGINTSF